MPAASPATPPAAPAPVAVAVLSSGPQVALPAPNPAPPSATAKTSSQPKLVLQPGGLATQPEKFRAQPEKVASPPPLANPGPPQETKIEPVQPTTPTAASAPAPKIPEVPAPLAAPAISSPPPTTPLSATAAALPSVSLVPSKPTPSPKIEAEKQPEVQTESSTAENGASTSELYFDVGKFKNQSQAHIEINKLTQLGFPATAVQKGFLWTNSYHILVGPYSDEERAKITHENLVSSGFKPRPFERGSRAFTLGSPVTLNGTRTPPGDYIISWESSLDDASVKLLHNDYLVATANGRWVKRDLKYPRDAYVYRRNADGSRTLLEIRFGGTHQALVFGKPS
jgi:SPOR domain